MIVSNPSVELLQHSSLENCAKAIRTCWQSFDKSDCGGDKDKDLIDRVGNKFKHSSTLEHLSYTFYIKNISRALLQELARHRIASLSVKSTRYTLKELKDEKSFTKGLSLANWVAATSAEMDQVYDDNRFSSAEKYLVFTGEPYTDASSVQALENLRVVLNLNISNDTAKYCLPESYKTELTWTINARSLQNFLSLRSSTAALLEIQSLAFELFSALPEDHKYLFENNIKGN